MTDQQQKEQFSRAFVHAVAAVAHFQCGSPAEPDDDSIDLTFRSVGPRGTFRSPKLDVQLKCTTRTPESGLLALPVPRKNYDDLRHLDFQVPRLLVVVQVPNDLRSGSRCIPTRWCSVIVHGGRRFGVSRRPRTPAASPSMFRVPSPSRRIRYEA